MVSWRAKPKNLTQYEKKFTYTLLIMKTKSVKTVIENWQKDLETESIRLVLEDLMEAQTQMDITDIERSNKHLFDKYPKLYNNIRDARKRVNRIRKEKFRNTELIYKN